MLTLNTVPPLTSTHIPNHSRTRASSNASSTSSTSTSSSSSEYNLGGPSKSTITSPGEPITSAREFMRGHGTYLAGIDSSKMLDEDGDVDMGGISGLAEGDAEGEGEEQWVMGSVAGVVERVNKLVSVRAMKGRYVPEVGDLLVGRILEVRKDSWKVDCNARLEGILNLGSVNLPGGVQRRKIESDQLKMRELLKEGDLLVAEVQGLKADGSPELHTRSLRYGKLRNGCLLPLPSNLIRRLKSHFITFPPLSQPINQSKSTSKSNSNSKSKTNSKEVEKEKGIDLILGVNGYVWVMESAGIDEEARKNEGFNVEGGGEGMYRDDNDPISPESRQSISLLSLLITIFARYSIPLTDALLRSAYDWCRSQGLGQGVSEPGAKLVIGEEMEKALVGDVLGVGRVGMI